MKLKSPIFAALTAMILGILATGANAQTITGTNGAFDGNNNIVDTTYANGLTASPGIFDDGWFGSHNFSAVNPGLSLADIRD